MEDEWLRALNDMNTTTISLKWQFLEFFAHANNSRESAKELSEVNNIIQQHTLARNTSLATGDDSSQFAVLEHFQQWFEEAEAARKRIDAYTMETNNLMITEAKKKKLTELQEQKWTAENDRELAAQSNCVREALKHRDAEQQRITVALASLTLSQKVLGRTCGMAVYSFHNQIREEIAEIFRIPREPSTITSVITCDIHTSEKSKPSRKSTSSLPDFSTKRIPPLSISSNSISSLGVSAPPLKKSLSSHTLSPKADSVHPKTPTAFPRPSSAVSLSSQSIKSETPQKTPLSKLFSRKSASRPSQSPQSTKSGPDTPPPLDTNSSGILKQPTESAPPSIPSISPISTDLTLNSPAPAQEIPKSSVVAPRKSSASLSPALKPLLHVPTAKPSNPFDTEDSAVTVVVSSKPDPVVLVSETLALNPFDSPRAAAPQPKTSKNPFETENPFDSADAPTSTNPFA